MPEQVLRIGETPVVIAGAGIGGLATALMLGRKGIPCTVLEHRTVLSEAGAGIQISPNASRVLIDIGLGVAVAREACEPERVIIRSLTSGSLLGEVAMGDYLNQRQQAPYWVMHRSDLHQALLDAVRTLPNIRLQIGRTLTDARSFGHGVLAQTMSVSGAGEDLQTPLLVGADGLWSATRRATGDLRDPVFQKYQAWRTTFPREMATPVASLNEVNLWIGPQAHVVHYPIKGGREINVVAVTSAHRPTKGWSTPGDINLLADQMRSAAHALREVLALPERWDVWPLYDSPARRMVTGRIALVGDAAHPVLPFMAQGAALSIEDAATLSEVLGADPNNIERALKGYERLRLKRVKRVQRLARRQGHYYHASFPLSFVRNAVMALQSGRDRANSYDWLYGWRLSLS